MPTRRGYCVLPREAFASGLFPSAQVVIRQAGPSLTGIGYLSKAMRLFADEEQERPEICYVWHPLGLIVSAIEEEMYVTVDQMDTYLHFYVGGV